MIEARYGLVRAAAFLAVLLFVAAPARAAGFQYATAPDPDDQPLELAIWYPSNGKASTQPLGLFTQEVAYYGPVKGDHLPLVVISHGTGGSAAVHYDTALALADAGFVVVAPSHTGDNYKDRQDSFTARNFVNRARHIGRVVDFMTGAWNGHDHLDATRIGIFGHSAGAATALIVIGAEPDFAVMSVFCGDHPDDWGCQRANERSTGNAIRDSDAKPPQWQHDARVKAAVIATPAAGPGFTKERWRRLPSPCSFGLRKMIASRRMRHRPITSRRTCPIRRKPIWWRMPGISIFSRHAATRWPRSRRRFAPARPASTERLFMAS